MSVHPPQLGRFLLAVVCLKLGAINSWSQFADPNVSLRTFDKLNETILPSVEGRNGSLKEWFDYIKREFIRFNPSEKDFTIVLQPPELPPLVMPGQAALPDHTQDRISLSLKAIPVYELMKAVAGLSRTKFRIQGQTVIFALEADKSAFLKFYTVTDWKLEAKRLYPDLADNRSPMFQAVGQETELRRGTNPEFFKELSWPLRAATIVAEKMSIEPSPDTLSTSKFEYIPPVFAKAAEANPAATGMKPQEIAKLAMPSVFTVIVTDSSGKAVSLGSGFLVRGDAVATNLHVIRVPDAAAISIEGGGLQKAVLVSDVPLINDKTDLAILRVSAPIGNPLPLGVSGEVGDDVYVIGSPRGLEGTFSTGVISAYREAGGSTQLQISAPISNGSSGGPVLNNLGRVIGVSVATIKSGQNLNFAVPVDYLRAMIEKLKP